MTPPLFLIIDRDPAFTRPRVYLDVSLPEANARAMVAHLVKYAPAWKGRLDVWPRDRVGELRQTGANGQRGSKRPHYGKGKAAA